VVIVLAVFGVASLLALLFCLTLARAAAHGDREVPGAGEAPMAPGASHSTAVRAA